MEITDKHIEQFLAAAHQTGERRLTRCSSGNLSWRIGEFALISATGSWLPELQAGQISICRSRPVKSQTVSTLLWKAAFIYKSCKTALM